MIGTIKYTSRGGGQCAIRTVETATGWAVVIHWPAGCQDFPDVLSCKSRAEVSEKQRIADASVRAVGFTRAA